MRLTAVGGKRPALQVLVDVHAKAVPVDDKPRRETIQFDCNDSITTHVTSILIPSQPIVVKLFKQRHSVHLLSGFEVVGVIAGVDVKRKVGEGADVHRVGLTKPCVDRAEVIGVVRGSCKCNGAPAIF